MPPVTRERVSLPVRSVTWMKVSFQVARMWQTANRSPETFCGPSCTTFFSSLSLSAASPSYFFLPPLVSSAAGLSAAGLVASFAGFSAAGLSAAGLSVFSTLVVSFGF